ncbi:MAG: hypothetical protein Q9192_006901 [Flavoplaca navasiana]
MPRATAHKDEYASHLRVLKYLAKLYNEHHSEQNTIPNPLIQLIHERLEDLVPPSIYRTITDYKTASNELLDLETIANDLGCNHQNKAEDDACQFVLLHDCIEHRVEDMKRLDAHGGMSETNDERFAAHLNCLGTLSAVRSCYAREDLELPDSIIQTIKSEGQKLSAMLREYSVSELIRPEAKEELEDLKDILEALEDTSGENAKDHHFEFSELKDRIAGKESMIKGCAEPHDFPEESIPWDFVASLAGLATKPAGKDEA